MAEKYNERNEWISLIETILAASAEREENGQGEAVDMGDRSTLRLTLNVSAVEGTAPSLAVAVETSEDGSTAWREAGAFTARSTTGSQRIVVPGCDRYVRAAWYIDGTTPAFTFSVLGEAA